MTVTVVIMGASALLSVLTPQAVAQDGSGEPSADVALSAEQAFVTVDRLIAGGRTTDAEALLRALTRDPSKPLRSEARFRLGKLRAAAGDDRAAVSWYQALLDEEPGAAAVRLELARTYARLGAGVAAARELRRAQASRLPLEVARQVDRISAALRSGARRGLDLSVGLAPDTNINRATASRTIDAQGITLLVDRDGRATSGVGLQLGASGFARLPLSSSMPWLVEATGAASLYASGRYDDIAGTIAVGPEFRRAKVRFRPSIVVGRRYFDRRRLSDQAGIALDERRSIGRTTQLSVTASGSYFAYPGRAFLDGLGFGLSVGLEKEITPRLFGLVGLSGSRSDARDPAYATTSIGGRMFVSRDAGRFTTFFGLGYQRLVADGTFSLFQKRRHDDDIDLQLGVSTRFLAIRGLMPSARVVVSRNSSSIPLYDFTRSRLELLLGRQF